MNQHPAGCPLCQHTHLELHFSDVRNFWQCANCDLVFVDSSEHLTDPGEKERYDYHENDPNDPHYRAFLNRLVLPLSERLPEHSQGLDFGCGPGPTVSVLLVEHGHEVACFDKFYANDPAVLIKSYDFITLTEVLEHLREPREELEQLMSMLKPGGYLGIMTKLLPPAEQFPTWHYKRDLTHIGFYADSTFEWIAEQWGLSLEIIASDVIILRSGN